MPRFLIDTFADPEPTLLEHHVADTGATWSRHPAFAGGSAGMDNQQRLRTVANPPALYIPSATPFNADYQVEADWTWLANPANPGILVRCNNATYTAYLFDYESGGAALSLYTIVAGAVVNHTTAAFTPVAGQVQHVTLSAVGSTITAYLGSQVAITITDTNIPAAGVPAVLCNAADTDTVGTHISNFVATDLPQTTVRALYGPDLILCEYTPATGLALASLKLNTNPRTVILKGVAAVSAWALIERTTSPAFIF